MKVYRCTCYAHFVDQNKKIIVFIKDYIYIGSYDSYHEKFNVIITDCSYHTVERLTERVFKAYFRVLC